MFSKKREADSCLDCINTRNMNEPGGTCTCMYVCLFTLVCANCVRVCMFVYLGVCVMSCLRPV